MEPNGIGTSIRMVIQTVLYFITILFGFLVSIPVGMTSVSGMKVFSNIISVWQTIITDSFRVSLIIRGFPKLQSWPCCQQNVIQGRAK